MEVSRGIGTGPVEGDGKGMLRADARIVEARPDESSLRRIWEVYRCYLESDPCTMDDASLAFEEFSGRFSVPGCALFLAQEAEGCLAGFACWKPCFGFRAGRELPEISVYLAPGRTASGIGRRLAATLAREAEARGKRGLLAFVSSVNAAGNRLFRSLGYAPCGRLEGIGAKAGRLVSLDLWQMLFPGADREPGVAPEAASVRMDSEGDESRPGGRGCRIDPWSRRKGFATLGFLRPSADCRGADLALAVAEALRPGSGRWRELLAYSLRQDSDWAGLLAASGFVPAASLELPGGSVLDIHQRSLRRDGRFTAEGPRTRA